MSVNVVAVFCSVWLLDCVDLCSPFTGTNSPSTSLLLCQLPKKKKKKLLLFISVTSQRQALWKLMSASKLIGRSEIYASEVNGWFIHLFIFIFFWGGGGKFKKALLPSHSCVCGFCALKCFLTFQFHHALLMTFPLFSTALNCKSRTFLFYFTF